ncbi:MAG: hypothetical protein ACW97A_01005 [Candidatus Thorarchaeota archaeon]|jgi:effector-binding domain-containing protein/predicted hydrocarbon binding protein
MKMREFETISFDEAGIEHKIVEDLLVASIRFHGTHWDPEIHKKLKHLKDELGSSISGPAFVHSHWGTIDENGQIDIEVGFPINQSVEKSGLDNRILPGGEVLSTIHRGSFADLRNSISIIANVIREHHLLLKESFEREILLQYDSEVKEIEVQYHLLPWMDSFSNGLGSVLGPEARDYVLQGSEAFDPQSGAISRTKWVSSAIKRLEEVSDDSQRQEILTACGHRFPEERIETPRAVYEKTGDIDMLLAAMHEDAWYEKPAREDNIVYVTKAPWNRQKYEEATSELEKKYFYCYCGSVREAIVNPEIEVSPSYCYCAAGWFKALWENILVQPVRVDVVKSILKGDDNCKFAIHLPET